MRTWIWISIVSQLMQLLPRQLMQLPPRQVQQLLPRYVLHPFQRWLMKPLSSTRPFAASPRSACRDAAPLLSPPLAGTVHSFVAISAELSLSTTTPSSFSRVVEYSSLRSWIVNARLPSALGLPSRSSLSRLQCITKVARSNIRR